VPLGAEGHPAQTAVKLEVIGHGRKIRQEGRGAEKGEGRREKGEGRRKKGEGRREKDRRQGKGERGRGAAGRKRSGAAGQKRQNGAPIWQSRRSGGGRRFVVLADFGRHGRCLMGGWLATGRGREP
jgi:hypothetical protein